MNELTTLSITNGSAFTVVDFNSLAKQLQVLADKSDKLSDTEKGFAVDLIAKWEVDVLQLISSKVSAARSILSDFERSRWDYTKDDIFKGFVTLGGKKCELAYENYMKALAYQDKQTREIEKPIFELDTTLEEREKLLSDYNLEKAKQTIEKEAATRKVSVARNKMFQALKSSSKVKEALDKIRVFESNAADMGSRCRMVSQSAKINVIIQNDSVRSALKEILNFSEVI